MDRDQAQNLIKTTFENPFDKARFITFIRNLLNHIEDASFIYRGNYIPDAFEKHINSLERIGKYSDGEHKIDVLIIHLKKETSIERARTMQRNLVAWYLNGSRGGEMKDAALVAYVSPDETDWRFSLVKMDYKFEQTQTGRIKVKEEFTPARRWSFLVGVNEKSHTAQSRLIKILADDEHNPTLSELEEAFNIETVTREFFLKYRDLFIRTKEELDRAVKNSDKIKADFDSKGVNTVDFAKKLLGQIVFLYFLQKKGWFGVERDANWGTGSKQFLRELFEGKHGTYKNFFNDILEPLFYEALRIDRSHDDGYYSRFNCKIPFLNGGLFDPIGNYDWVHTDINLPNELFSNNNKTKEGDIGDGILDVFDRYNFTVREDEPLEKEVAIDPELLGKAYEKFNAIRPDNFEEYKKTLKGGKKGEESKFNKQYGVYYTPREIVHYMCQQSLINYLLTELGDSVITKEDIETLFHIGEHVTQNEEQVESKGKETRTYYYKLPEGIRKNAELIDKRLADIIVCDPAVGSGAFPVGMMSEIIKARIILSIFIEDKGGKTPYDFKRHCIEHSLYGVDIDPGAVEIAKLRLWLSLIVDEEDISQIKPLPNLDYKIVCGNSLLGVKRDVLNDHLFKDLEILKPLYFNETNPTKKQDYKKKIDNLIHKITNGHTEFDFEVYFSEVFHEKGGFDIMIANPPYVRADSGPEHLAFRKKLLMSKTYKTLYEKWDLMVPFVEKGLSILNPNGSLIYITSNAICTSKYAFKLLDLIQKEYYIHSIDYFEDMVVFEAGVIPVVLHVGKADTDGKTTKIIRSGSFENIVNKLVLKVGEFKSIGRDAFRKEYKPFTLKAQTVELGDICYVSVGMVINADEKSAKGKFTKNELISKIKLQNYSRKYVEGKDIDFYIIRQFKYLEWGTKRVPGQLRRQTFPELYEHPKIMRGRVTGGIYDETGLLCNDSIVVFVRFIDLHGVNNKSIQSSIKKFNRVSRSQLEKISEKFDLKYLLAILNSTFALKYLNNIRRHRLEDYFYPDDFRKLPIADLSYGEQKPFIELVDKILFLTQSDDYLQNPQKQAKVKELEQEIDQLVYQLYGLTDRDIEIIESAIKL